MLFAESKGRRCALPGKGRGPRRRRTSFKPGQVPRMSLEVLTQQLTENKRSRGGRGWQRRLLAVPVDLVRCPLLAIDQDFSLAPCWSLESPPHLPALQCDRSEGPCWAWHVADQVRGICRNRPHSLSYQANATCDEGVAGEGNCRAWQSKIGGAGFAQKNRWRTTRLRVYTEESCPPIGALWAASSRALIGCVAERGRSRFTGGDPPPKHRGLDPKGHAVETWPLRARDHLGQPPWQAPVEEGMMFCHCRRPATRQVLAP